MRLVCTSIVLLTFAISELVAGPEKIIELRGPGVSEQLDFSPDGTQFIEMTSGQITFWDLSKNKPSMILGSYADYFSRASFSKDGKKLLVVNNDNIEYWDIEKNKALFSLPGHTIATESVAISPDGLLGASGGRDNDIFIIDLANGKIISTLKGHTNLVYSVTFSPDSQLVASGSVDGTVKLWKIPSGTLKATLKGHKDMVVAVSFLPSGNSLVSASADRTVRIWNTSTGKLQSSLTQRSYVNRIAISPDGTKLICDTFDGYLAYWNLTNSKLIWQYKAYSLPVRGLSIHKDGKMAISKSSDAEVRVWNLEIDPNKNTKEPILFPFVFDRMYPVNPTKKVPLPDGTWAILESGMVLEVYKGMWARLGLILNDAAVRDGRYWAIGNQDREGGFNILYFDQNGWKEISGGATQIQVDNFGNPWIVNNKKELYKRVDEQWKLVESPPVYKLSIGRNGSVWIIDSNYKVQGLLENRWLNTNKSSVELSVSNEGIPFISGYGNKTSFYKDGIWQETTKYGAYLKNLVFGKSGITVVVKGGLQGIWYSMSPFVIVSDQIFTTETSFKSIALP